METVKENGFNAEAGDNKELLSQWKIEQVSLKAKLIVEDVHDWTLKTASGQPVGLKAETSSGGANEVSIENLHYVGGVDISFVKGSDVDAVATLVVLSYPTMKVVHEVTQVVALTLPYIPGYLAFREVPHLVKLFARLREECPSIAQELGLVLVDGNGVLHPRGFGLASHLGVLVNVPTVGIGKNLHAIDGLERDAVRAKSREMLTGAGDAMALIGNSGKLHGWALRTTQASINPIFVSVGHRIASETALGVVRAMCKHRVPEP